MCRPLSGNTANWRPYNSLTYIDQLALDGLFWASSGDLPTATDKLVLILKQMQCCWDASTLEYSYPNICDTYHMAVTAILVAVLGHAWAAAGCQRADILPTSSQPASLQYADLWQHYIAMRSQLLRWQVCNPLGEPCGWVSSCVSGSSVINTETVALCTIALSPMAGMLYAVCAPA